MTKCFTWCRGQRSGHLYTATYRNQNSSGLQSELAYWPAQD